MWKKILSLVVASTLFIQSAFALTLQQVTDNAILLTKREPNYGRFTIDLPNGYTSSIQFLNYELEWYEWQFKLTVNTAYNNTLTWSTWFIQYMDTVNTDRLNTYNSWSVHPTIRAKSLLWTKMYKNFLKVRNDPNMDIPQTNTGYTNRNTWWGTSSTRTFTALGNYIATNGKTYTIWQSSDGLYRYYKWTGKSFTSQTACLTYVEVQNRIIHTAPNGRKYWIFKINTRYYFNRDEWSISELSWVSIEDVKAYINQHNQPLPQCQSAKERRCY